MSNTFIWADLSTFDIRKAKRFYQACFGWTYQNIGENYLLCQVDQTPSAGLYTMPEKFQNIGMPSFWMSYIQVNDINSITQAAEKNGAKIELSPQAAPGGGQVALIRDPAGAGFTCYEGEGFGDDSFTDTPSQMAWNELFVSDLSKVESFYSTVFNWTISPSSDKNRHDIFSSSGDKIAGLSVVSNELKGDKEYWGVYFGVENLQLAAEKISGLGGSIVVEEKLRGRQTILVYDNQDAALYLIET